MTNYTLVIKRRNAARRIETHRLRVFERGVQSIDWSKNPTVYLRVSYGRLISGKHTTTMYNDGIYTTRAEFAKAKAAFFAER